MTLMTIRHYLADLNVYQFSILFFLYSKYFGYPVICTVTVFKQINSFGFSVLDSLIQNCTILKDLYLKNS